MTENIFSKDLQLVLRLFSWKDELRWYLFDHLVHFGKLYHQPRSSKPSDAEVHQAVRRNRGRGPVGWKSMQGTQSTHHGSSLDCRDNLKTSL